MKRVNCWTKVMSDDGLLHLLIANWYVGWCFWHCVDPRYVDDLQNRRWRHLDQRNQFATEETEENGGTTQLPNIWGGPSQLLIRKFSSKFTTRKKDQTPLVWIPAPPPPVSCPSCFIISSQLPDPQKKSSKHRPTNDSIDTTSTISSV